MTTRRDFLAANAALLGASVAGTTMAGAAIAGTTTAGTPVPSMAAKDRLSILVLGGTGFIGPHQIEYALARGHDVAMFNRGSNPGLFGDRVEEHTDR